MLNSIGNKQLSNYFSARWIGSKTDVPFSAKAAHSEEISAALDA